MLTVVLHYNWKYEWTVSNLWGHNNLMRIILVHFESSFNMFHNHTTIQHSCAKLFGINWLDMETYSTHSDSFVIHWLIPYFYASNKWIILDKKNSFFLFLSIFVAQLYPFDSTFQISKDQWPFISRLTIHQTESIIIIFFFLLLFHRK